LNFIKASDILDKCDFGVQKGEDECDFIFQAYKCFWDGVRNYEADSVESVRFSLYDVLGFNRLYDEEEVLAEMGESEPHRRIDEEEFDTEVEKVAEIFTEEATDVPTISISANL
jgi:hypothetical protein